LDQNARQRPWAYIGAISFGALLIGFILGRRSYQSSGLVTEYSSNLGLEYPDIEE
jgi:hypothetical protein